MSSRTLRLALSLGSLLLGGCGPPGGDFLGLWSVTDGTTTTTCGAARPQRTTASSENVLIVESVDGSGIVLATSDGCFFELSVSGTTASANSGQHCQQTVGPTSSETLFDSATLSLSTGVIDLGESQTIVSATSGGAPSECTVTLHWTLTKIGKL